MPSLFFSPKGDNFQHHSESRTQNRASGKRRFFFWLVIAFLIFGIVFLASIAFAYKFYSTSQKVIDNGQNTSFIQSLKDIAFSDRKALRGEKYGRINILLVGLAGKNYPGANLTDSIIIASVDPKTYQTALLSVPRDLYVPIPGTNSSTKINALYARSEDADANGKSGIENLKYALADITGQPIDYYIALDFDGFEQIINELGGIKVQVPKDLHDERYPGPNYSYETFDIKKGLQTLDGETALKFARTRHNEDGDFGRAYRQQLILESARSKAFSLGTILNIPELNNMLDTLGEHLRTDIPLDEFNSFIDLVKKIDTHTTTNKVLDAGKPDSLTAVSHVMLGNVRAFILIPRTGNYDEIQDLAKNIFDLDLIARKKQEIKNENATVAIVNESGVNGFDGKLKNLLDKFDYQAEIAVCRDASNASACQQRWIQSVSTDTTVYDLTGGLKPFSLEDLSKKLGAKIENGSLASTVEAKLPPSANKPDFILVAGSDITDKLNYEENSVQDLENGYDHQQVDEKTYIDLLKKGSSQRF
ncbi:MAG: LCP family protein [Candidatus Moranbacteria bacterium]|nr:LCP family protein [Candidatus Moranbacteria bacterium]